MFVPRKIRIIIIRVLLLSTVSPLVIVEKNTDVVESYRVTIGLLLGLLAISGEDN